MTEIEEPQIKELEKVVFRPFIGNKEDDSPEILRIENEENFTRIDFIVYSALFDWVQINKHTYIRPVGSTQRLTMVKAINIPIAPQIHLFKNRNEFLCYTLYFPPLSKDVTVIDIIELEASGGKYFNFYNVSMERVRSEKIVAGN